MVVCYEAGRDGFWPQRVLAARGVACLVVDSASILENRRARRAKSDRLDATALVRLSMRHQSGERGVWSAREWGRLRALQRDIRGLEAERARHLERPAIGIVAVARRLLVALWRYLEAGVLPEGALLKA